MPIKGLPLTIEPSYPKAAELMAINRETEPTTDDVPLRNRFWSFTRRAEILIWEEEGKIVYGLGSLPSGTISMQLHTLDAADAWGIEQESNAVHTLGGLLRHRQFKQYLLTGSFLEQSKRSGVHYMFRRLRPTLALSLRTGSLKALCSLCMHPIGYYQGTWAGAMTPTDDVVAHLMMMRGDEHMFWRRCNQHPVWRPEAGLA
jgi:hypothetical protein